MTHFTVLVAADNPDQVDTLLAPYDENDEKTTDPKWDWWVIGGRWSGSLAVAPGHEDEVIHGDREVARRDRCDGGPKYALDLDRMRREAGDAARERHREYCALTAGTPEALPWRVYAENISEGNGYTAGQARREYHDQPRVKKLEGTRFTEPFGDDPIEEYSAAEDLYAARAAAHAVAGYALLTTDGEWVAPGDMGWFGISTDEQPDRDEYARKVTAYIEALPASTWLIMVDAHI